MSYKSIKKIFIAGAGGMMGQAFYKIFLKSYDLKCTDIDINEKWLSYLDFRDFEDYKKQVYQYSPDYLFHMGAYTDLEFCEKNINDAYNTNTLSVHNATSISNDLGIPLLYISTAGIFDGNKEFYDDWDKPNPISQYAKTKYAGELYVKKNANNFLICRAGWLMGGGPKKDKKFINKIIKQIENGSKELFIVNDKSGTPTYTIDFAMNVKKLIDEGIFGLFNLVCEGNSTRYEVAKELLKILNLSNNIKIHSVDSSFFEKTYFAKRPRSEMLINKKLNKQSLNIMRDWKECLREYIYSDFSKHIVK